MRRLIAALLASLLASSATVFATEPGGIAPASMDKAIRIHSSNAAVRQTDAQQSAEEDKPWIERHPVWFGLIAGAGAGAAWGAFTCRDGCFLVGGPGGAAIIGSWFGAGPGALIGWAAGRAK